MPDAKAELEGLWAAMFGEPPAVDAEPRLLAELILRCSEPPPAYEDFRRASPPGRSVASASSAPFRTTR
jgi:hypothetical protein